MLLPSGSVPGSVPQRDFVARSSRRPAPQAGGDILSSLDTDTLLELARTTNDPTLRQMYLLEYLRRMQREGKLPGVQSSKAGGKGSAREGEGPIRMPESVANVEVPDVLHGEGTRTDWQEDPVRAAEARATLLAPIPVVGTVAQAMYMYEKSRAGEKVGGWDWFWLGVSVLGDVAVGVSALRMDKATRAFKAVEYVRVPEAQTGIVRGSGRAAQVLLEERGTLVKMAEYPLRGRVGAFASRGFVATREGYEGPAATLFRVMGRRGEAYGFSLVTAEGEAAVGRGVVRVEKPSLLRRVLGRLRGPVHPRYRESAVLTLGRVEPTLWRGEGGWFTVVEYGERAARPAEEAPRLVRTPEEVARELLRSKGFKTLYRSEPPEALEGLARGAVEPPRVPEPRPPRAVAEVVPRLREAEDLRPRIVSVVEPVSSPELVFSLLSRMATGAARLIPRPRLDVAPGPSLGEAGKPWAGGRGRSGARSGESADTAPGTRTGGGTLPRVVPRTLSLARLSPGAPAAPPVVPKLRLPFRPPEPRGGRPRKGRGKGRRWYYEILYPGLTPKEFLGLVSAFP